MAHINSEDFESLWEGVKERPLVRRAQPSPIQADLSLTGILNRYMAVAANQREWGKISQQDYNDLNAAVSALKIVLGRVNESAIVADAVTQNAADIRAKLGPKAG
ncbi:MAG: hypothetical protein WBE72_24780 [Terracidiphilus sp.]